MRVPSFEIRLILAFLIREDLDDGVGLGGLAPGEVNLAETALACLEGVLVVTGLGVLLRQEHQ